MKLISFEKKLSLFGAVCLTIGAVIGVAIFVIVGEIGAASGPYMPLVFALAAIPAVFGAMVAAALGGAIPADGGGFVYARRLLGLGAGRVSSWLIILGALGSIATVSIGVADYMRLYFPAWPYSARPFIAMAIICLAWGVNAVGIMASERFQIVMVGQLVAALALVVGIALARGGNPDFSQGLPSGVSPFMQAVSLAVISYIGFNIIAELGDEIVNPKRNIPLTIMIGLGIVILVYIGVGWVVSGTMTPSELAGSEAALIDTARRHVPGSPVFLHFLNLGALTGALTSINSVFLAVPREFAAQAEAGLMPRWMLRFNPRRQTFPNGIGVVAVVGCALTALNLRVGVYGLFCVSWLTLVNVILGIGALRLFKLFPRQVAESPVPIRKWWLFPATIITIISSLVFGLMALGYLALEVKGLLGL